MDNITVDEKAELEALRAEKAARALADQAKTNAFTLKVSTKGAVSIYGLGKWPVTLYLSQWERVLSHVDNIKAFIELNKERLAVKAPVEKAE